jgi:putative NADPH-quinone reductase
MADRIVIIQGHPDAAGGHLCNALADAYADGAAESGRAVKRIEVAALDFPLMREANEFRTGTPPPDIAQAQDAIKWADHLLVIYPLWLGTIPALLKAFFEQVLRPGFAFDPASGPSWAKLLMGRSARIVVTMGMPVLVYRWYFGAHSLKSLERNILKFVGISPIRENLFGMVEAAPENKRAKWLAKMRDLGRRGA